MFSLPFYRLVDLPISSLFKKQLKTGCVFCTCVMGYWNINNSLRFYTPTVYNQRMYPTELYSNKSKPFALDGRKLKKMLVTNFFSFFFTMFSSLIKLISIFKSHPFRYLKNVFISKFIILSFLYRVSTNLIKVKLLTIAKSDINWLNGTGCLVYNSNYCIKPTLSVRYEHVLTGENRALTGENVY